MNPIGTFHRESPSSPLYLIYDGKFIDGKLHYLSSEVGAPWHKQTIRPDEIITDGSQSYFFASGHLTDRFLKSDDGISGMIDTVAGPARAIVLKACALRAIILSVKTASFDELDDAFGRLAALVNNYGRPSLIRPLELNRLAETVVRILLTEIDNRIRNLDDVYDLPESGSALITRELPI